MLINKVYQNCVEMSNPYLCTLLYKHSIENSRTNVFFWKLLVKETTCVKGPRKQSIIPKGARNFQYLIKIKEDNREKIWNVTSENADYGYSSTGTVINENADYRYSSTGTVINENVSTIPTETPIADFDSNVTEGYSSLFVQFTDLSENATEWCWDFGDNTYSTDKNPVHTSNKSGKYTVSLMVKNENGIIQR